MQFLQQSLQLLFLQLWRVSYLSKAEPGSTFHVEPFSQE